MNAKKGRAPGVDEISSRRPTSTARGWWCPSARPATSELAPRALPSGDSFLCSHREAGLNGLLQVSAGPAHCLRPDALSRGSCSTIAATTRPAPLTEYARIGA